MNRKLIIAGCGLLGCVTLLMGTVIILALGVYLIGATDGLPEGEVINPPPAVATPAAAPSSLAELECESLRQIESTISEFRIIPMGLQPGLQQTFARLVAAAEQRKLTSAEYEKVIEAWAELLADGVVTDTETDEFIRLVDETLS